MELIQIIFIITGLFFYTLAFAIFHFRNSLMGYSKRIEAENNGKKWYQRRIAYQYSDRLFITMQILLAISVGTVALFGAISY